MSDQAGLDSTGDSSVSTLSGSVARDVANALSNRTRRLSAPLVEPDGPAGSFNSTGLTQSASESASEAAVTKLPDLTPASTVSPSDPLASSPVELSRPSFAPAATSSTTETAPARARTDDVQSAASTGLLDSPSLADPVATPAPSSGHLGSVTSLALSPTAVAPAPKKPARRRAPRQTRKARLRISRVDPWSVMKTALLFGVAGWIIFVVATWVVFTVLDMTGIYTAINDTVSQVFASPTAGQQFDIKSYVNTTRATALAALIGAVDVILLTALATIFAFLYNLSANVMGGVEVTLAED